MKFGDVSSKWDTWYERLKKPNKGFSFDKQASLASYLDAAMTKVHGDPDNNVLWTRENLSNLEKEIIDQIKSQMTE